MPETRYWFKRKRYGWGWTPVTWQGWATVGGCVAILLPTVFILGRSGPNSPLINWVFGAVLIITSVSLVLISFRKGPPPRWRWGAKPDDDPMADF